jgi:hypothetical protein
MASSILIHKKVGLTRFSTIPHTAGLSVGMIAAQATHLSAHLSLVKVLLRPGTAGKKQYFGV